MQALTVTIGPAGIKYFAQELVADKLITALSSLKAPNKGIPVPDFGYSSVAGVTTMYSRFKINLLNGTLRGFSPSYAGVTQQENGQFLLSLSAGSFDVDYTWRETYDAVVSSFMVGIGWGPGQMIVTPCPNQKQDFPYRPKVGHLTAAVTVKFSHDAATKSYAIKAAKSTATSSGVSPNIPAGSAVQHEEQQCFSSHVSAATTQAVSSIDFTTPVNHAVPPLINSIPESGHLAQHIVYEFAVGDSGVTFPNDQGIAIGVTGKVKYQNDYYPGTPPAALPVPPVPTDNHHLHVYVSDYEVNALHWAFYKAGKLNTSVKPDDLPNPDVLKVKTYLAAIPSLKRYATRAMFAEAEPKEAPKAAFQEVYEFTKAAMATLEAQLPAKVYADIVGLDGNAYVKEDKLQEDLKSAGVPTEHFKTVENATKRMGMAVEHNLEFTVTIQTSEEPKPKLVFDLVRTDILRNLELGVSGTAQTLKYKFEKVAYAASFVSTTIHGFDKGEFGGLIWPVAGEPRYDQTLQEMGQTGVPLPIMSGFHFLFEDAELSIQDRYVSVLANVQFKS